MTFAARTALGSLLTLGVGSLSLGGYVLTRPKDVETALESKGKTLLNFESEDQGNDYAFWLSFLVSEGDAKNFAKWNDGDNDQQKVDKLKGECKKIVKISYSSEGFSEALEKAEKFCIRPNSY